MQSAVYHLLYIQIFPKSLNKTLGDLKDIYRFGRFSFFKTQYEKARKLSNQSLISTSIRTYFGMRKKNAKGYLRPSFMRGEWIQSLAGVSSKQKEFCIFKAGFKI